MDTLHNDTGHTMAELLKGIFVILDTAVAQRLPSMGTDIGDIPIDYTVVYMIVSGHLSYRSPGACRTSLSVWLHNGPNTGSHAVVVVGGSEDENILRSDALFLDAPFASEFAGSVG